MSSPNNIDMNNMPSLPGSGNKRGRRMRSIQGQAGLNDYKKGPGAGNFSNQEEEFAELEKSGAAAFLIKTYQLISTCDPELAEWSDSGETFTVKDTTKFASVEIPKYFEHKNFSSFSRQLNFYGFKKVPQKAGKLKETKSTAGHVRFHNDKFKRGRIGLLSKIHRSTKNNTGPNSQQQEVNELKARIQVLEQQMENVLRQHDYMVEEMNLLRSQVNSNSAAATYPSDHNQRYPVAHEMNTNESLTGKPYVYQTDNIYSDGYHNNTHEESCPTGQIQSEQTASLPPHPDTRPLDSIPPPPPNRKGADRGISAMSFGDLNSSDFDLGFDFSRQRSLATMNGSGTGDQNIEPIPLPVTTLERMGSITLNDANDETMKSKVGV